MFAKCLLSDKRAQQFLSKKKKKNYLSLRVKGQVVFLYFRSGNNKTCRRADEQTSESSVKK